MAAQVVIVGGGFGGLETAFALKSLGKPRFDITLIDKSAYHAFIPSIHLIISGKVKSSDIRIPLGPMLGASGIRFLRDTVVGLDAGRRELITEETTLAYDYCVISTGATNNFFDLPGAEQFARRFRTPEDAEQIGTALRTLLEEGRLCRIAVAGAGTEGVEVAGEMLDLVHAEGRDEDLKAGRISIELFEGKSALLPALPAGAGAMAEDYLRQHGVSTVAGDRIAGVGRDSVLLESGQKHDVSLLVWSGGIQPSRLVESLPFPKDPWGWLKVTEYLHVTGDERVYGIGDAASIYSSDGPLALQRLAYHAQDQARVAALNIAAHASGRRPLRYEPKNKPQLISIGNGMGIFSAADRIASGAWVVTLKKVIERKHLMTYLSKPLSSALWSRLPGADVLQRIRARLLF